MCQGMSVPQVFAMALCLLTPLFAASDRSSWDLNFAQGRTAFEAGQYAEAVPFLKTALDEARTVVPHDYRFVESAYTMALTYQVQGQLVLAEPLYLEAKTAVEALGTDGRPLVPYVLVSLGKLRFEQGRFKEAELLLRQGIDLCTETHGATSSCTLAGQRHLGELLSAQGHTTEAGGVFQQLVSTLRQVPSSSPEVLAGALCSFSAVYIQEGRFELAEPLLRESLELMSKNAITGPTLADSLLDLGELYRLEHDPARAEPLLRKALNIYDVANDPHRAGALNELGLIALDEGKFAVAKDYFDRSLGVYQRLVGSARLLASRGKAALAEAFLGERNVKQARTLIHEALASERESLGDRHCEYARLLIVAAKIEEAGRRTSDADTYYRQALGIYRQSFADGAPERSSAERNYARFTQSLRKQP